MIEFEWDGDKAIRNLDKHGVRFETAALAFADPNQLTEQDRIEGGEWRWQLYGLANAELLMVAFSWSENGADEVVRIVSARRATKAEWKRYVQNDGSL